MGQRTNAAVIGAGAAGLVCARELARQNIEVTIFEKSSQVGGVWVYEPEVDDDITGVDPTSTVHSSLYDSLRTNLPRDLMAFSDYYFDSTGGGEDTWPRYPHHSKVLEYLERFAVDHDLTKTMRLGATVTRLKPSLEERGDDANRRPKWLVESEDAEGNFSREAFDAVAVCNGHYSKPRVPILPGMESFPGYVIHSHNYRRPDEFKNMKVAVWGTAASGADIAREIASVATDLLLMEDLILSKDVLDIVDGKTVFTSLEKRSDIEDDLMFWMKKWTRILAVFFIVLLEKKKKRSYVPKKKNEFTARIQEITAYGLVTIKFSEEMKADVSLINPKSM